MLTTRAVPAIITSKDDVHRVVDAIYESPRFAYSYDFETLDTRIKTLREVGLSLAWGHREEESSYIVTLHDEHPYVCFEDVLEVCQPLFEDPDYTQIAHNSLFDGSILAKHGVELHSNTYDTMVMSWLLDTSTPNGLKKIVRDRYDVDMTELVDLAEKVSVSWSPNKIFALHKVDVEQLALYGAEDARWTFILWDDYLKEIQADRRLNKVYHELYQEFLRILIHMQVDGTPLDVDMLKQMAQDCGRGMTEMFWKMVTLRPGQDDIPDSMTTASDIDTLRKQYPDLQKKWSDRKTLRPLLYERPDLAHKIFSPNSGQQLNKILFEEMKLKPVGNEGANGYHSTASDVLTKLLAQDKTGLVSNLMQYKKLTKLHGTYLEGLPPLVDDDGRIRTSFRVTLQTGRLASSSPNLLNIINHDAYPVRKAFVASPGRKLIVADYSQIELRIVAHLSKDETMIDGFKRGIDPHSVTAKDTFNLDCPAEEVPEKYPKQRKVAKVLNFGILYGAGPRTIRDFVIKATEGEVTPSLSEVESWTTNFFRARRGVRVYLDNMAALAEREGKVYTLLGRPRHLPDAQSPNPAEREAAKRQASNSPVQGGAFDTIALAMRNIARALTERGWYRSKVWLLLQVHDELVLEADEDVVECVSALVKEEMESALSLSVPLVAKPVVADNWYDGK